MSQHLGAAPADGVHPGAREPVRRGAPARAVHIARRLGTPAEIAPADVTSLFERYQNVYGQERS